MQSPDSLHIMAHYIKRYTKQNLVLISEKSF